MDNYIKLLKDANKYLVLSINRNSFTSNELNDLNKLNIHLEDFKILIVKSGYLSPELKTLKADNFMILTDGFVTQDFKKIKNIFRERPIFPFQKNFNYPVL